MLVIDRVHPGLLVRDDQFRIKHRHLGTAETGTRRASQIMRFQWLDRADGCNRIIKTQFELRYAGDRLAAMLDREQVIPTGKS